jgi:hypothetical protein
MISLIINILLGAQGFPIVKLKSSQKQAKESVLLLSIPNEVDDVSAQIFFGLSPHIFLRSQMPKES